MHLGHMPWALIRRRRRKEEERKYNLIEGETGKWWRIFKIYVLTKRKYNLIEGETGKWWRIFKIYVLTKRKYNLIEGEMELVCSKNGVEGKFTLIGKSKRNGQFIRPRIDGRIILKCILRYDV